MAEGLINVGYEASSLSAISGLSNFGAFFEPEMSSAMQQVGDLLVQAAQTNTWTAFQNPTGQLASAIAAQLSGPMEVIVTVDVPYAWRREAGFIGTDSLGRHYNDPAEPYAMPALEANQDQIAMILGNAAAEAFAKVGARR